MNQKPRCLLIALTALALLAVSPVVATAEETATPATAGASQEGGEQVAADWATAQDGPACSELLGGAIAADTVYDCCERHLDMCAALCTCGFKGFQCWDNGRGGCASVCQGCKICV